MKSEGASKSGGWRLAADQIEQVVLQLLQDHLSDQGKLARLFSNTESSANQMLQLADGAKQLANELTTQTQPELKAAVTKMVQRIDLNAECITIQTRLSGLHDLVTAEEAHAKFNLLSDAISAPLQFKKRGVETKIVIGDRLQAAYEPNQALIMLIAQAHHWLDRLTTGSVTSIIDLAIEEQVDKNKISRALRYAYLAPDIIQSIFDGRQPVDLTAETMRRLPDLPMEWRDQRNLLGFH